MRTSFRALSKARIAAPAKIFFRTPARAALAAAVLTASVVTGVAAANIPSSGGTINGCYNEGSGVLHVIDPATSSCHGSQTPISWNQVGPTGPPGPAGPAGTVSSADALGGLPCDLNTPDVGTMQVTYTPGPATGAVVNFTCVPTASHLLTISKAGSGTGTVTSNPSGVSCGSTCAGGFGAGTSVTLSATALPGSAFTGWAGACTGSGVCHVSMQSDQVVTATFSLVETLTVTLVSSGLSGAALIAVMSTPSAILCSNLSSFSTCTAQFVQGTSVTLSEQTTSASFTGWAGDCPASTAPTCMITMDTAHSVTANFGP